jgi:hypothetical protein
MSNRLRGALRGPSVTRRLFSVKAHTLYSPTPAQVEQYLGDSLSSTSATAYLLSTSIDPSRLQSLISPLQSISSIGSFSSPLPGQEPSLSIVTFDKGVTFQTDLSGRPPVEVGRFKRPGQGLRNDDLKGTQIGEGEAIRKEEGWAGLWKGEAETSNIPELSGVR